MKNECEDCKFYAKHYHFRKGQVPIVVGGHCVSSDRGARLRTVGKRCESYKKVNISEKKKEKKILIKKTFAKINEILKNLLDYINYG